jgi:hypothetical protein
MLDVVLPFELMLNPFCCREFLRVEHHHKRLNIYFKRFHIFPYFFSKEEAQHQRGLVNIIKVPK